jgi:AhpC/TSA family
MKANLLTLLLLIIVSVSAQSQIKSFTLTDVSGGSVVSLDQYTSSAGVVVLFTSNACPYDTYYTERLASLVNSYSGRIPFLLVNAHLDPEESEENMKAKASGWSFKAPYLADKNQVAMSALGARRSPEAFLLKPEKGSFVVLYSGAIDDNPQEPGAVTTQHLRNAIDSLLAGKLITHHQERAVGCSIRKK